MNAGIPTATSWIIDKTGIPGYLPDAHSMPLQDHAPPPGDGFSTKRILPDDQYEILTGGNGIAGHDETSEDIATTWDQVYTAPTPGIADIVVSALGAYEAGNNFRIFPNPASEYFIISYDGSMKIEKLIIFNQLGQEVMKESKETERISITNLEPGIYIVELVSKDFKSRQKLIKNYK